MSAAAEHGREGVGEHAVEARALEGLPHDLSGAEVAEEAQGAHRLVVHRAVRALRLDQEDERLHGARVAELAERVDGGAGVVGVGLRPRLRVRLS